MMPWTFGFDLVVGIETYEIVCFLATVHTFLTLTCKFFLYVFVSTHVPCHLAAFEL